MTAQSSPVRSLARQRDEATRLRGWRLRLALLAATPVVLTTLGLFLYTIPFRFADLNNPPDGIRAGLAELGVSVWAYAVYLSAIEVGLTIVFGAVATAIFWQKRDDWIAILVSVGLFAWSVYITPPLDTLIRTQPALTYPATFVQAVGLGFGLIILYNFPYGRFEPRWTKPLAVAWIVWTAAWVAFPALPINGADPFNMEIGWFTVYFFGWYSSGIVAQVYRYLRLYGPVQKQQSKWVVFGLVATMVGYATYLVPRLLVPSLSPNHPDVAFELFGQTFLYLTALLIPVSLALSILRYRLWDIDSLINRAIVYTTLTAILAGLYTASIVFTQRVFVALTGQQSDGAVVLTTLVVAAAFTPVKSSLQSFVDRYFKGVRSPDVALSEFRSRVDSIERLLNPSQLACRLLDESVRSFGASGGAIDLNLRGGWERVGSTVGWPGDVAITVPLDVDGTSVGRMQLGRRKNGSEYTEADLDVLNGVCGQVAQMLRFLMEPSGSALPRSLAGIARVESG